MDTWTVGQWLTCDRNKRHAIVTELYPMRRGLYATLYHPENNSRLCGSIQMLQEHGWRTVSA